MDGKVHYETIQRELSSVAKRLRECCSYIECTRHEMDYRDVSFLYVNTTALLSHVEQVFLKMDDYKEERCGTQQS